MNVQFECADKVNGRLTVSLEPADYQKEVDKKLREIRKNASMHGFRPGMVPQSIIKKQFGSRVKLEEVNRLVSDSVNGYIRDNKLPVMGMPIPSTEQKQQDLEGDGALEFVFDIAVAPEIDSNLTEKDIIDYYVIKADDKAIDEQVKMIASQYGEMKEATEWSGNDTLKGDLRQLDAEGNTLENGITTESGVIMPSYIKDEEEKKKFEGAKPGDIIIFNPKKAYPDNDSEVASLLKLDKEKVKNLESDFSFQITAINHFQPAEVDAKLFEKVFGEGVKDEADFRQRIASSIEAQLAVNGDMKFLEDVRKYIEQRAGDVTMPREIIRRVLLQNNADKENAEELVEKNLEGAIGDLKWQIIRDQLAKQANIKVEEEDVKVYAREDVRRQFASYGMTDIADELLDEYVGKQLEDKNAVRNYVENALVTKLIPALKQLVTLKKKEVSLDEFREMMKG